MPPPINGDLRFMILIRLHSISFRTAQGLTTGVMKMNLILLLKLIPFFGYEKGLEAKGLQEVPGNGDKVG